MGALQVPDVSGSSLEHAALRYAEAGFFVLPVARGKHPGSIVGKGWPDKSTTDAEQIEQWWTDNPDAGIAIHTGASGLTIFDLDVDAIPEELEWLRTGIVQFSRAESVGSERGHYGFFTGDEIFRSGKLRLADGTHVGEVKSGNSVVIASPSEHVHADTKNGEYRWRADDLGTPIPKLPSEARVYLRLRAIKKPADGHHAAMAGWCVEATDDAVSEAVKDWQSESRPKSLLNLVNWVKSADAGTRDRTRDALRIAACESRVGFYPLADVIEAMHAAMLASYTRRGEPDKFDDGEFLRLMKNGVGYAMNRELDEISDEANREYTKETRSEPIFKTLSAHALATLDAPTEFLIKRVLKKDTFGVNGGPKKSLKTHDNLAIGLAVATGTNLYNDDRFEVPEPQKVLYIVGEGGENQIARIFQRMLAAYGIKREDVDSTFPFVASFGAAPLDSPKLRDEINRLLDDHQPTLVLMESFYNFHPVAVTASNLYERGQLIDQYHKLVRAGGSGVTSLLTDHTKKNATGLDLDEISMSGQAENADSWIMRGHRFTASVQTGDFWLTTSFNGRDWGGNTYDVDWHLGPFNHDQNAHDGTISWDVHDHGTAGTTSASTVSTLRTDVLALVNANPWRENRSSLVTKLKKNRQMVINEITTMLVDKIIEEDSAKNRGASGKAPVFGPGPAMTAAMSKFVMPKLP